MISKRHRVTVSVPLGMKEEMQERVIKEGYGFKGKSKWVEGAVFRLLNIDNFEELVNSDRDLVNLKHTETFVISDELNEAIQEAVLAVRKRFPLLEGVRSSIIRTSIVQRLIEA